MTFFRTPQTEKIAFFRHPLLTKKIVQLYGYCKICEKYQKQGGGMDTPQQIAGAHSQTDTQQTEAIAILGSA